VVRPAVSRYITALLPQAVGSAIPVKYEILPITTVMLV
jgi:hypothetical protein